MSRGDPTYWRVSPNFWRHAAEHEWSDDVRQLAFYLLTCPHRKTEGLYWLPVGYMATDLAWVAERVTESLATLQAEGFAEYDHKTSVVFLPKAMKYQRPDNPNQWKAAIRSLKELPETCLFAAFFKAAEEYAQGFAQALREAFAQGYTDPPAPTPAPTPDNPPYKAPLSETDGGGNDEEPDDVAVRFDGLWSLLPKRHGDKKTTRSRFAKLSAPEQERCLTAARNLRAYLDAGGSIDYIPLAENFVGGSKARYTMWVEGTPALYRRDGVRRDLSADDLFAMAAMAEAEDVPDSDCEVVP